MVDYARIKIVSVSQKIEDLSGLLRDLKAAFFNVVNVGSDERGTYLYMDANERKDPRPIVENWIGRPVHIQAPTTSFIGRMFRKIW